MEFGHHNLLYLSVGSINMAVGRERRASPSPGAASSPRPEKESTMIGPCRRHLLVAGFVLLVAGQAHAQEGKVSGKEVAAADLKSIGEAYVAAFNSGKAADVAAQFLPDAEVVDESGNVYKGRDQIRAAYEAFFSAFPGATMTREVTSTRPLGPSLVVEDGILTRKAGDSEARNLYTAIYVLRDGEWQIASARESIEERQPSPRERLESLSWLVGEWISEESESLISVHAQFSEDEAFLLIDYQATVAGQPGLKSRQRIGWDPLTKQFRSWVFDSDGGYGDGYWVAVGTDWIVKSKSVLPNGETGSATFYLSPSGPDKFLWKSVDRIRAGEFVPDLSLTFARKPPEPKKD